MHCAHMCVSVVLSDRETAEADVRALKREADSMRSVPVSL